ncbi:MAG: META domain-containing protein [Enterovibrio sp.]
MKSESTLAQLQQSHWQLEGASAEAFTLALVDGKLVGTAGCNRYFAGATSPKNGVLTLSAVGTTRMACEPEMMKKEGEFLQALQQVGTFKIEGKKLILSDAKKKALLTFNALAIAPAAPAASEPATLEATPADSTQPAANPEDKVAPHPAAPTQPAPTEPAKK